MKRIYLIAIVVLVGLLVAITAFSYWYLYQPEHACNRMCGYNPMAPYPTGGTCMEAHWTMEEPYCQAGNFIEPDCCCVCIV